MSLVIAAAALFLALLAGALLEGWARPAPRPVAAAVHNGADPC